jgi:hypothetical protein
LPTLSDLARLRRLGKAPSLPVFLTRNPVLSQNLESIGVYVLRERSGDWRALAGLDVVVDGIDVETALAIREARPRRLQCLTPNGLSVIL